VAAPALIVSATKAVAVCPIIFLWACLLPWCLQRRNPNVKANGALPCDGTDDVWFLLSHWNRVLWVFVREFGRQMVVGWLSYVWWPSDSHPMGICQPSDDCPTTIRWLSNIRLMHLGASTSLSQWDIGIHLHIQQPGDERWQQQQQQRQQQQRQ